MRGRGWGEYCSFEGILQQIDTSGDDCELGLWDELDDGDDEYPDRTVSVSKDRMWEAVDLLNRRVRVKGRIFRGYLIALPSSIIEDLGPA